VVLVVDAPGHLGITDDVSIGVENHEIRYPENLRLGSSEHVRHPKYGLIKNGGSGSDCFESFLDAVVFW